MCKQKTQGCDAGTEQACNLSLMIFKELSTGSALTRGIFRGATGGKKQLIYKEAMPNEHETPTHTLVIILGAPSFRNNSGCLRTHPSLQHWLGSYSRVSQRTLNKSRFTAHTTHSSLKDI